MASGESATQSAPSFLDIVQKGSIINGVLTLHWQNADATWLPYQLYADLSAELTLRFRFPNGSWESTVDLMDYG